MQNMTKQLLTSACALLLSAAANAEISAETDGQKSHQADSGKPVTAIGPAADGKVQNSKLQKFLDWPPASDAAKKRMRKK